MSSSEWLFLHPAFQHRGAGFGLKSKPSKTLRWNIVRIKLQNISRAMQYMKSNLATNAQQMTCTLEKQNNCFTNAWFNTGQPAPQANTQQSVCTVFEVQGRLRQRRQCTHSVWRRQVVLNAVGVKNDHHLTEGLVYNTTYHSKCTLGILSQAD